MKSYSKNLKMSKHNIILLFTVYRQCSSRINSIWEKKVFYKQTAYTAPVAHILANFRQSDHKTKIESKTL